MFDWLSGGWYVQSGATVLGPFSRVTFQRMASYGTLEPDMLVREGSGEWYKASQVHFLSAAFARPNSFTTEHTASNDISSAPSRVDPPKPNASHILPSVNAGTAVRSSSPGEAVAATCRCCQEDL